ncbi:MAG: hypothetical protein JNL32_04850 [Candidatus Kapabacteria bacterium]|nr:hypothetical protein [Candidatus Kapabacteria bacterium]
MMNSVSKLALIEAAREISTFDVYGIKKELNEFLTRNKLVNAYNDQFQKIFDLIDVEATKLRRSEDWIRAVIKAEQ